MANTSAKKNKRPADADFLQVFKTYLHDYFQLRSLENAVSKFADNVSVIGSASNEIGENFAAVKSFFADDIRQVSHPIKVLHENVRIQRITDEVAQVWGTCSLQGKIDGVDFEMPNVRFSYLLRHHNDKFEICHIHISVPQEEPGDPESYPIRRLTSALHETEEKFRLIFENAPVGLLHFDQNGIVKECNRKFLQIMGSSAEKIIGLNMLQMPDQQAIAAVTSALRGRTGFYEGYYRAMTSGKVTPLKAVLTPVLSPEAKVVGGIGIYEDTSEHKLAESKLHYQFQFEKIIATISSSFVNVSAENLSKTLLNALKLTCQFFDADRCYIFLLNSDGTMVSNTHEWCEADVVSVKQKYQNIPLETLTGIKELKDGKVDYILIPDTSQIPIELQSLQAFLVDDQVKSFFILPLIIDQKVAGCFGYDCVHKQRSWSFEEITLLKVIGEIFANTFAKKAAEKKLYESEEKYRLLAENSSDVIWIADIDEKRFTYISPSAEKMFGIPPEEILLEPLESRLPEKTAALFYGPIPERAASMRSGRQNRYIDEADQLHRDGTIIPTEVTTSYIIDPVTQHTLIIGVTRDISIRKEAERQRALLDKQQLQNQKADSLGRMAGAIAHHFNNQLQVVMGNLELLNIEIAESSTGRKRLADALKATSKAAELSSLMLSYLGQTKSKAESLHLTDACQMHLQMLKDLCPKNIQIEYFFANDDLYAKADPGHLQQILMNVVTNAFEAIGDAPGKIIISLKRISATQIPVENRFPIDWQPAVSDFACLEIADNGCGINQQDLSKVFDPFFSSKFTGRGLGLPVALGFMRSIGGAVSFTSSVGTGSKFSFYFSLCNLSVEKHNETKSITTTNTAHGVVLLVEDEEMVRFITINLLEHFNYQVLAAKSGEQAIELFKANRDKVKLAICDLVMPGMDGWQTLEALRSLAADLPVILASGYDQNLVMKGNHKELPNAFLSKPYGATALRQAIVQAFTRD